MYLQIAYRQHQQNHHRHLMGDYRRAPMPRGDMPIFCHHALINGMAAFILASLSHEEISAYMMSAAIH